jgi:AcrR family transcriptional regulator
MNMFIEHAHYRRYPPPMLAATRASQKERTRQRILAAARARFLADGYERATIRDIARDAEVAVGSVHAHFGDKRALLRAGLHDGLARTLRSLWDTLDADAPLTDQLVHCARALFTSYAKQPALSRVMLAQTLFPDAGDPPDELIGPYLARVASLFEAAAARGEVALDGDTAVNAARTFFSLYLSTLVGGLGGAFGSARSARARAELWSAQLEPLVQLLVDGLRPGSRR